MDGGSFDGGVLVRKVHAAREFLETPGGRIS
jgi:hypothetical protein